MKRTKETYFREHPAPEERAGISGLTKFDGEDQEYDNRDKQYKEQQRAWIEQQKQERKWREDQEKNSHDLSAKQTQDANKMRQMLDKDFVEKKQTVQNAMREENLLLAKQKKDKEERERQERIKEEQEDVRLLLERGRRKPYT